MLLGNIDTPPRRQSPSCELQISQFNVSALPGRKMVLVLWQIIITEPMVLTSLRQSLAAMYDVCVYVIIQ